MCYRPENRILDIRTMEEPVLHTDPSEDNGWMGGERILPLVSISKDYITGDITFYVNSNWIQEESK